jgi:acetyl-CoA synthetase
MKEIYPVSDAFKRTARTNEEEYLKNYQKSIEDPDEFWAEQAHKLEWIKPFTQVKNTSFDSENFKIEWFADGQLNLSANCLDRHLKEHPYKPAIIWEGDHPSRHKIISFVELHDETCRFANVLKKNGVKKGDRVILYMPMVSEAAIAMLACARIGAVHCVVFGGFSPDSLASRIEDSQAKVIITADSGMRGGKPIYLKENVDVALNIAGTESVEKVIVVHRSGNLIAMKEGRDVWYHMEIMTVTDDCPPEPMNAEDPLFILYTSGSTGKPKGVLHTTGGYLTYVNSTFREIFDIKQDDVFW